MSIQTIYTKEINDNNVPILQQIKQAQENEHIRYMNGTRNGNNLNVSNLNVNNLNVNNEENTNDDG